MGLAAILRQTHISNDIKGGNICIYNPFLMPKKTLSYIGSIHFRGPYLKVFDVGWMEFQLNMNLVAASKFGEDF